MPETSKKSSTPRAAQDPKKQHDPRIARFTASVLLLSTLGLLQLISQRMASGAALPLAQLLFVFLGAFTHEWNLQHGEGLTRHRRAYFDIVNVLETYQTRARTHGHLFQASESYLTWFSASESRPDPPTPLVTFAGDVNPDGMTHEASTVKTDFINARDAHYANMFQFAMKMNKELDMMEKAEKEQKAAQQSAPSVAAKPKEGSKKSSSKSKSPQTRKKGSSKKVPLKENVVKM
ncbi:hypothetical protein Aduo_014109 [Ancylostoma duodenale]